MPFWLENFIFFAGALGFQDEGTKIQHADNRSWSISRFKIKLQ